MSAFTDLEREYLQADRRLGRLATVGRDGTPHVVPVAYRFDPVDDSIEVHGYHMMASKKFEDVWGTGRAAIVVDDVASVDPWRPRGIEMRGRAEIVMDPTPAIRIYPERIVSWGIEGSRFSRAVGPGTGPAQGLAGAYFAGGGAWVDSRSSARRRASRAARNSGSSSPCRTA